jgi:hypothetical protein
LHFLFFGIFKNWFMPKIKKIRIPYIGLYLLTHFQTLWPEIESKIYVHMSIVVTYVETFRPNIEK